MAELEYTDKRAEVRNLIKDALSKGSQVVASRTGVPVGGGSDLGAFFKPSGGLPAPAPTEQYDSGIAQALKSQGIDSSEDALRDWIIGKESSGNVNAKNPNSSAFGLGQLIIANRKAYGQKLGIDPNTTDYNEQLALMDAYVKERYGSYAKAKQFWEEHGWY